MKKYNLKKKKKKKNAEVSRRAHIKSQDSLEYNNTIRAIYGNCRGRATDWTSIIFYYFIFLFRWIRRNCIKIILPLVQLGKESFLFLVAARSQNDGKTNQLPSDESRGIGGLNHGRQKDRRRGPRECQKHYGPYFYTHTQSVCVCVRIGPELCSNYLLSRDTHTNLMNLG
jgi:hypothetical protein